MPCYPLAITHRVTYEILILLGHQAPDALWVGVLIGDLVVLLPNPYENVAKKEKKVIRRDGEYRFHPSAVQIKEVAS